LHPNSAKTVRKKMHKRANRCNHRTNQTPLGRSLCSFMQVSAPRAMHRPMQDREGALERGALLTVKEVAARLRVSRATVYAFCAAGKLPHVRFATHAIRVFEHDLVAVIQNCPAATPTNRKGPSP
jgi:excisionase family DNA binding protein